MKRKSFCTRIDPELIERMRNIVYWTPGLSLADLIEQSLEICITSLEEQRGSPFPERDGKLGRKL